MVTEKEIRDRLAGALELGQIEAFEDWFVCQSWNVHQAGDFELQEFVYSLELLFAEYTTGHISDSDFRRELADVLSRGRLNIGGSPATVRIQSGSALTTSVAPVWHQLSVDRAREVAFS